jgi:lipooligosaccharide transport system permease protein
MARVLPPAALGSGRAFLFVERNVRVARRAWLIPFSGFFEALLYLLGLGIGVGGLVGAVEVGGASVPYEDFVAPAMLAASAMNGAVFETTGNVFFRLHYEGTHDAVLATPLTPGDVALAEVLWALARGGSYAAVFVAVMAVLGLTTTPWALLLLPAALLVGLAFAAAGLTAVSVMRSWADLELVQLATLPLFLFSATFVPLADYPGWAEWIVRVTPLYQGVALLRDLSLGTVGPGSVLNVAYLAVMALVFLAIASRRVNRLLLG